MLIDSPLSHRVSRFLVALLLIAAMPAAIGALVLAGMDTRLIEGAERIMEEVRSAWTS